MYVGRLRPEGKIIMQELLREIEITTQVILEPSVLKNIVIDAELNRRVSKAIAEALGLTGKYRVNAYGWDLAPQKAAQHSVKSDSANAQAKSGL